MEKNYTLNGYHIRLLVDLMYGYRDIKITKNDKVVSYYTDEEVCVDGLEEKAEEMIEELIAKEEKDKTIDNWLSIFSV
jgi:hypothetical protein